MTRDEKKEFVLSLLAKSFEMVRSGEFGSTGLSSCADGDTISDFIFNSIYSAGLEEGGPDND